MVATVPLGLTQNIGPARLVAAGESDEVFAMGQVIEDRGFFSDTDRVLGRHHVAEGSQMQVLDLARPMGVQDAGVWTDFVAF